MSTEKKYPVWMDCDTGTDDSIAIMLAHALKEIDLLGISSVCGNTTVDNVFWNNHRINGLMGTDYPVYRGAEKPLMQELHVSTAFHGKNGIGDAELPVPEEAVIREEHAWDALYACAKAYPHELRLIATGPLTNIAIAFTKYPELPSLLHTLLFMGGSAGPGNITPAAEFNIYTDPVAADIVFRSGVPLVMCGLDVTIKAILMPEDIEEMAAAGGRAGAYVKECLQVPLKSSVRYGLTGVSMHDSCPVMFLAHPELFEGEEVGIAVETHGTFTNGKTVTDLYSDKQFPFKNAFVVLELDRDRFVEILKESVESV